MKCIAFNRRGTLLAAGCHDGSCVIWDFETRGIAKELRDKDCTSAITSVCWSKYGHHILTSATDKSLTLWNVVDGEKVARVMLPNVTLHARLHPGSYFPSTCLACPLSSAPILVDLNTGSTTVLPVSISDVGAEAIPPSRNKFADGSPAIRVIPATFNKHGDLIYVGNANGEILITDSKNTHVRAVVPISGVVIKHIIFSRNGQYLLTNSNDRTIRVYENLLPLKDGAQALDELSSSEAELEGIEKLKAVGSKCLVLFQEFQDSVTKIQWKAPCFSGDGEWVVGASATKGDHKIYIWGRAGHLVKFLEGPKEALSDLAWHPVHPILVSLSVKGLVYIWAKDYTENWSAFAPDFKELEENEEYEEREDEFDLMPDTEKVKELDVNEDEEVDIVTVDKDSAFSDSDTSQEELCFLPAIPSPDIPEQQDKFVGSSTKLEDSTHSGSPLSEEAGQNGQEDNLELSPVEVVGNSIADDMGTNGRVKRKRKPSEKGLEMQAEKGRKPLTKIKPSGKSSKARNKSGEGQDTLLFEDDVTDEYM
ncbi:protein RBL isoform X2 [Magnolia sinica]|nr:protein RBL isoform X2 [Magnolia sinica]